MSSIFVVDAKTFREMDHKVVQDVFRHRHILVTGMVTENLQYNLQGLMTLGSLTIPRHMQGNSSAYICVGLLTTIYFSCITAVLVSTR